MTESASTGGDRLNKYLALHLGISRREADKYIDSGRVRVNSSSVKLGARIQPGDLVDIDNKAIAATTEYEYLTFHKPAGYVSSRRAQGNTPTLYDLLPKELHHLKTVGRLDKDSSGLLLLTNDGDFAYKMTHPKFYKTKIYEVRLDRPLQPLHQQMIADYGIQLDDGISKFALERIREGDDKEWVITMSEGRNRQIRRTFAALGYAVTKLHRTNFGGYSLGDIKIGEYKRVDIS